MNISHKDVDKKIYTYIALRRRVEKRYIDGEVKMTKSSEPRIKILLGLLLTSLLLYSAFVHATAFRNFI